MLSLYIWIEGIESDVRKHPNYRFCWLVRDFACFSNTRYLFPVPRSIHVVLLHILICISFSEETTMSAFPWQSFPVPRSIHVVLLHILICISFSEETTMSAFPWQSELCLNCYNRFFLFDRVSNSPALTHCLFIIMLFAIIIKYIHILFP